METVHFVVRNFLKSLNLKMVRKHLFDRDFVLAGELHKEYMHNVHDEKDDRFPKFDLVAI